MALPRHFTGFRTSGFGPSGPASPFRLASSEVADAVEALAAPAAGAIAGLAPLVPAELAEALGRLGLPQPARPSWEAPHQLLADEVEAALVALRPTIEAGGPDLPSSLRARLAHPQRVGSYAVLTAHPLGRGPVAVEKAVSRVRSFAPELPDVVAALVAGLTQHPAVVSVLDVPAADPVPVGAVAEETRIVAEHGAAHLALAVAVGAAALRAVGDPLIDDEQAAAVGLGVDAALRLLPDAPMPAAHAAAALARAAAEYAYPRYGYISAHVRDNWIALAEGPLPAGLGEPADGLVRVVPGGMAVRTGMSDGQVAVLVSALDAPPGADHRCQYGRWHEISEVSFEPVLGGAQVAGLAHPIGGEGIWTAPPWPGSLRARVHARGRDDGADGESGRESYEIVVWPAPPAPPVALKAIDRLGHRLRGEPEPPVPERPWRQLSWVADSAISMAATVTVVVGAGPREVVTALGGDPDAPVSFDTILRESSMATWVMAQPVPQGTLLIEDNGWMCSRPEVVARLSAADRAASMYWNVNMHTRLSMARRGEVLLSEEPFEQPESTDEEVTAAVAGLDLGDSEDTVAKALLAVGRFTGYVLTRDDLDAARVAGVGYRVTRA